MSASMIVELSSEMQPIVHQAIQQGGFNTPAEVISAALQTWQDLQDWPPYRIDEMQRMCDEALADKRPGIPAEEAHAAMVTFCRTLETEQRRANAA